MRTSQIEAIASKNRTLVELVEFEGQVLSAHLTVIGPSASDIEALESLAETFARPLEVSEVTDMAEKLLKLIVLSGEPDYLVNELIAAMLWFDQKEATELMPKLSARWWELRGGHYKPTRKS